ncbi:40S ribosomal protein S10-like [Xenia sp. Carnegie-2017]|uniref:40S ribosomal protein S10-like n=1 Tax=Xenia sp. Carnegie-2017 TaxID=2897299 RepID=UPI001F037F94|nr:40S ribosomal protein S10-like [Xenia sp. Carnegie-2017]
MLIPKKNRTSIYEYLFKEGVMVAKKDFNAPRHPDLETVPNLQVIKAMQSLRSRGYVKEQFAWKHYYWYLTNEGITYLRDYLNLPPEIVPATLRRPTRSDGGRPRPKEAPRPSGPPTDTADREAYRRGPASEPKGGAGSNFNPEFRGGGFGRGGGGFGAPSS